MAQEPKTGNCKTVFETEWFSIEEEKLTGPGKFAGQVYYRMRRNNSVIIFAVTKEKKIILVRQYRPAVKEYTLEFPCGAINDGENAEDAAARELHEETGYRCGSLNYLGSGRVLLDRLTSQESVYYAQDCELDIAFVKEDKTEVCLLSLEEFKNMILKGKFEQLSSLGAVLLAEKKCGFSF